MLIGMKRLNNFQYDHFCESPDARSEPGSSVSIVPGYWLDDWAIEDPSPAQAKGFFL
jgi:hypothetical protein